MSDDDYEKISTEKADLKIKLEKAETQTKIAIVALVAMIVSFGVLATPWVAIERVQAIGGVADVYFLGLASVIGAFMGFTAWMSKK